MPWIGSGSIRSVLRYIRETSTKTVQRRWTHSETSGRSSAGARARPAFITAAAVMVGSLGAYVAYRGWDRDGSAVLLPPKVVFRRTTDSGQMEPKKRPSSPSEQGSSKMSRQGDIGQEGSEEYFKDYIRRKEAAVINDSIHGVIQLPVLCARIVDTPQFQRLRNIKQLGAAYWVYPGAAHNRFEHSIGTCHLAGKLVKHLRQVQEDEIESLTKEETAEELKKRKEDKLQKLEKRKINERDILCVQIAALCHDLGHGPFSHMFDNQFIFEVFKGKEDWKHEQSSCDMFDYITENLEEFFEEYELRKEDCTFIKQMINPPKVQDWMDDGGRKKDKPFLYEIVSNETSKVDVDKWDYFARDAHNLGMKSNFNHDRFISFTRVSENKDGIPVIAVRDKEEANICDMFYTRRQCNRRFDFHKTVKIIETMMSDALKLADNRLTFSDKNGQSHPLSQTIKEMSAFAKVDDRILDRIRSLREDDIKNERDDADLKKACKLLDRIERRDLYICVDEAVIDLEAEGADRTLAEMKVACLKSIPEEIAACYKWPDDGTNRTGEKELAEDILVQVFQYDYAQKKNHPAEKVYFYTKMDPAVAFTYLKPDGAALPAKMRETILRVSRKTNSEENIKRTREAFKAYCSTKLMILNPQLTMVTSGSHRCSTYTSILIITDKLMVHRQAVR